MVPNEWYTSVDLVAARRGIRQGEGTRPPVGCHRSTDPCERDAYAHGQGGRLVQPVEVKREHEPSDQFRPSEGQQQWTQDDCPADQPRHDLEGPLNDPSASRVARIGAW